MPGEQPRRHKFETSRDRDECKPLPLTWVNPEQAPKRTDTAAGQPAFGEMGHRSIRFLRIPNIDRLFGATTEQLARVGYIDRRIETGRSGQVKIRSYVGAVLSAVGAKG